MNPPDDPNSRPRRGALAGLVLIVLLILAGLILSHILGKAARMQDCVISGRTDCSSAISKANSR